MSKLSTEIQRLAIQQRDFLIKVLEACVTLKTHVETDLQNGWSHIPEVTDARETFGKAKTSLQMSDGPSDVYGLHAELIVEKQRLQNKYQEMMLQCQLDDLIGNSGVVFDFGLLKQAVANIQSGEPIVAAQQQPGNGGRLPNHLAASQNPILFLANYCMSQLYSRHVVSKQQHLQNGSIEYHHVPGQVNAVHVNASVPVPPPQPPQQVQQSQQQSQAPPSQQQQLIIAPGSPSIVKPNAVVPPPTAAMLQNATGFLSAAEAAVNAAGNANLVPIVQQAPPNLRGPSTPYPLYYFNIEVNGSSHGRIVIEVRPDVAPKMVKNFSVLATGEIGVGYKGCTIFQCWEGESVITGDFELNNGRGGRSIFEDGYFMPDDTKFPAVRGAVGMRRTQKRHDNLGMVGSQFRIILQEMRGFTGIFGHVVEGLDLVEKISTYGDQTGKPTKTIMIAKCGKL